MWQVAGAPCPGTGAGTREAREGRRRARGDVMQGGMLLRCNRLACRTTEGGRAASPTVDRMRGTWVYVCVCSVCRPRPTHPPTRGSDIIN